LVLATKGGFSEINNNITSNDDDGGGGNQQQQHYIAEDICNHPVVVISKLTSTVSCKT